MALIVNDNKKVFEKPNSGTFIGVIADVVDLGIVPTKFGNKAKVRIVWVLGKQDGSGYALDSENNPFRVMSSVNATMNEKSDLFKLVRSILGAAPPVPYDVEQLIGKSNLLFIVQEPDAKDPKIVYANVKGILALPAGTPALAIPAGFTRHKDKKDTRGFASGPATAPAAAPLTPATAPAAPVVGGVAQVSADLTNATPAQPSPAPATEVVLDKAF